MNFSQEEIDFVKYSIDEGLFGLRLYEKGYYFSCERTSPCLECILNFSTEFQDLNCKRFNIVEKYFEETLI